jgi:hypothetical protein
MARLPGGLVLSSLVFAMGLTPGFKHKKGVAGWTSFLALIVPFG